MLHLFVAPDGHEKLDTSPGKCENGKKPDILDGFLDDQNNGTRRLPGTLERQSELGGLREFPRTSAVQTDTSDGKSICLGKGEEEKKYPQCDYFFY